MTDNPDSLVSCHSGSSDVADAHWQSGSRCMCQEPRGHDGPHRCGFVYCRRTWQDNPESAVQGSGNSTETPAWTAEQLLYDLNDRIDRAVVELKNLRAANTATTDHWMLLGKINGLLLVRDWLRAYEPVTKEEAIDRALATENFVKRSPIKVACSHVWDAAKACNAWGAPASHGCKLDPGHEGTHICLCGRKDNG